MKKYGDGMLIKLQYFHTIANEINFILCYCVSSPPEAVIGVNWSYCDAGFRDF